MPLYIGLDGPRVTMSFTGLVFPVEITYSMLEAPFDISTVSILSVLAPVGGTYPLQHGFQFCHRWQRQLCQ